MIVWSGLDTIPVCLPPTSVAIGTFDGVHVGHQELIRQAVEDARRHGRVSAVLTFDRHPAEVLRPDRAPGYITTPSQRAAILESMGADHLVVARFDAEMRERTPDGFLREVATGKVGARAILVGAGFRFGRNREGDVACLREAQERHGFKLHVVDPVMIDGQIASSTRVRNLLRAGQVSVVARVLGRNFALAGTVVEGQRLGRTLGFPTANLQPDFPQIIPADGIYATLVNIGTRRYMGACNIGFRPTAGGETRTIEVHLLHFSGDLYGKALTIEFAVRLRDEVHFENLELLVEQMGRDVDQTEVLLAPAV